MESIEIDADMDSPERLEILGDALDETRAEVRQKHENGELSDAELEAAEARIDEIRDERDEIRDGMDGERTNTAGGPSSMPTGEWGDHEGPTDEWGTEMRGELSHERLNQSTESLAVEVYGMLSTGEWTGFTDINYAVDQKRPDVNTAIYKLEDNDLIETDYSVHPPQYRLLEDDVDIEAVLPGNVGESRTNMAGVPQDIDRDASGIGEPDLSDVPTGEWDSDTARLNRRVPTDTDNADEMPSGEWPMPGGERLNSDSPKSAVFERLSTTEWKSRKDIASPNDRLGVSGYEQALTHLCNDGMAERNESGEYRALP